MGRIYGKGHQELKPAKLTVPVLTAIGRLVRACAEIEDLVDLFIAKLAELSETKMTILLGRTAVTRRIEIAEQLAAIRTDGALKVHAAIFNEGYYDVIDCRNAVAHGTLLGKSTDGMLYFLTSNTSKPKDQRSRRFTFGYAPKTIIAFAQYAEQLVPHFEQALKVQDMRAERLQRPLSPHPKAQPQRSAKSPRQPQS